MRKPAYDMGFGIMTLGKQRELLEMKRAGRDISGVFWEHAIGNYLYFKRQARENLRQRLKECETEIAESIKILEELKR